MFSLTQERKKKKKLILDEQLKKFLVKTLRNESFFEIKLDFYFSIDYTLSVYLIMRFI
jgi:hypothetical protein